MASQRPRLSRQSIHERLGALTPADYLRLSFLAHVRALSVDMEPGDLLHQAVLRAYEARTCAEDVGIIAFLSGIMRSLVSQHARSADARLVVRGLWTEASAPSAPDGRAVDASGEGGSDPDDIRRAWQVLAQATAGDDQLERLVDGLADGLFGARLAAHVEVDTVGLATAKRRLARRLRAVQGEKAVERGCDQ